MNRRTFLILGAILALTSFPFSQRGYGAEHANALEKSLPAPNQSGGGTLMDAFAQRHSTKSGFRDNPISEQMLSDLLWATWGVNRPDGRRTAPSAMNRKNAVIYVLLSSGVWRYDAPRHVLIRELDGDRRSEVGDGTVILLYAAPKETSAAMLVGSLYQNAGLYCASTGLGNVVRSSGASALENILQKPSGYQLHIAQSIGWPK